MPLIVSVATDIVFIDLMMNSFHKSIIYSVFGSLAAVGLLVSVTACKDDFDYRNNVGQPIAFTLSAPDAWHDGMSVNENAPTTRCTSVKALSGGETKLYLHTVVADNPAEEKGAVTRGTPVTPDQFKEKYETFSLSGICYTGEYPTDESENKWTADYAYNLSYKTADGEAVKSENSLLWPSNGNVRFFAFAPTTEDFSKLGTDGSLTLSDVSHEGSPTLTYTVPAVVTEQIDLMTAQANASGPTTPEVKLTFGHALTAVQIKCGEDMLAGTITEVSISGVYGSGTQVIGSKTWDTSHASTTTYTITKDIKLPSKEDSEDKYHAAEGTPITGTETDNLTFMLIPQTLPEDATITIIFTDSATGMKRSLSGSIADQTWEAGKIVTYTLSQSSIHITPKIEFSKKPATADNPTGDVMPYSGVWYDVDYKPAKVEIVQAGVDTTQIATIPIDQIKFKYRLEGSEEWVDCTTNTDGLLTIEPQPAYVTMRTPFGDTITKPEAGSESDPESLTVDGESANCYLVDKAGYYSLPLVYGNGNRTAYTPGPTTTSLTKFPDHAGNQISQADIQGCDDAVLVWQDAPDLIDPESVGLSGDKKTLKFRIRSNTLTQGNAVLAVVNSSKTILWSWHIWVTPYKDKFYNDCVKLETSIGSNTKQYSLTKYNLGWCDAHLHNDARHFSLQAVIDMSKYGGSDEEAVDIQGSFTQDEFKGSDGGDNTYYQWGRKDPMLGGIYNSKTPMYKYKKYNKDEYDNVELSMENKQVFNEYKDDEGRNFTFCKNPGDLLAPEHAMSDGATIEEAIQHPYMFITNSRSNDVEGVDYNYRNHWHVKYENVVPYNVWNVGISSCGVANPSSSNLTADLTKNAEVGYKSVYDPCPPGFRIPPADAFRALANYGGNYNDHKIQTGYSISFENRVWKFKKDDKEIISFPATGVRDYSLRSTEWNSVEEYIKTKAEDTEYSDLQNKLLGISLPAFRMLTYLTSATIFGEGKPNLYRILVFHIDDRAQNGYRKDVNYWSDFSENNNRNKPAMNCFTGSSPSYGLSVRPMKISN